MSKKLSTEEFVAKAREYHGDKYDYSKTEYVNQTTPVVIICPEHGEFNQRPNNHYMGAGCPMCSGNKRSSNVSFVEKAKTVHGNRYDYSQVVYKNNKTKITIICPEHGAFEQTPDKHLRGEGCPYCSQAKLEATNIAKYGAARPLQNSSIRNKQKQTCRDKYGVDNPSQVETVKQKRIDTCVKKYGVPYVQQSTQILDQRMQTCRLKYGGNSPFCSQDVRKKAADTIYKKYGVRNAMRLSSTVYKVNNSKLLNQTFHISIPEQTLYEMLCEYFGADDVARQYSSVEYPFACDFYIVSRNLYIELNASWTHGGHWFGTLDSDNDTKNTWLANGTDYYNNAVTVWSEKDLNKRAASSRHNLNYVVFWDNKLRDAAVWFALDCPDGRDWEREYSWLPERIIKPVYANITLTGTSSNLSAIAKNYQLGVFYEREIQMWNENAYYHGVPLQIWLYYNRYKFLNKAPNELSDAEILRGFTISGVCKGYTVFDSTLMQQIIDDYSIKSVYDPCAGWGERMLCCYYNNVAYTGVDVNEKLRTGHSVMIAAYGMTRQEVVYADSSSRSADKPYDAVITCPPYHNIEIYSDIGAENYGYEDFLKWWNEVVKQCASVRYFCFQINSKYKQDMADIVSRNGFTLVRTYAYDNNKSSHFTRKGGANLKKESETMLVFEKKDNSALVAATTIKQLRECTKMSQSEFAAYFGVTLRCLRSWEQGQRNTPAYVVNAFKKIIMYENLAKDAPKV